MVTLATGTPTSWSRNRGDLEGQSTGPELDPFWDLQNRPLFGPLFGPQIGTLILDPTMAPTPGVLAEPVLLPAVRTYVSYGHSLTGYMYSPTEQETYGSSARHLGWDLGS